jgi:hypothetical protein
MSHAFTIPMSIVWAIQAIDQRTTTIVFVTRIVHGCARSGAAAEDEEAEAALILRRNTEHRMSQSGQVVVARRSIAGLQPMEFGRMVDSLPFVLLPLPTSAGGRLLLNASFTHPSGDRFIALTTHGCRRSEAEADVWLRRCSCSCPQVRLAGVFLHKVMVDVR